MKKFLTSGLILGLAISPAIADTLYNDQNAIESGSCNVTFLGSSSGTAANSFVAEYIRRSFDVDPGEYLPSNAVETATCPANSYCGGGTYEFSETNNQGITSCPDNFALSAAGTSSADACYHVCTASDIVNGGKVASVTGGTVTSGGVNTCTATCTTGYTFKAAVAGSNPFSGKESIAGTGYAAKGNDGNEDYTGGGKTQSDYNLTQDGSWGTSFSYGDITGISSCNSTPGNSNNYKWDNDSSNWTKPGNTFNQSSTGQYCWCKITGYTPTGGTLQNLSASSSWVFSDDYGGADDCAISCADRCADGLRNDGDFRAALLGSVGATSEPAACVANEITVSWDQANGQGSVTNTCTYDGDITLPTAPEKTGYTFSGWKLVTGSSN